MHSKADTLFPDHHWVVVPLDAIKGHLMHIVLAPKRIKTVQAVHEWRTSAYRADIPAHILVVREQTGEWNLYECIGKFRPNDKITVDDVPEPYREQLQMLMALES